ncbi:CD2 antigen cytoplasmic tail-binding protein, partial [Trifolium medium]|nr:CD2 antigen cytoplasmic tail-binding protein [Trifolium medium]
AKRARFTNGKKEKPVDVIVEKVIVEENVNDLSNPVVAAKERVKRRKLYKAKRLKGSGDREAKTSEEYEAKISGETEIVFDQLIEDAMKLMESGECSNSFSL